VKTSLEYFLFAAVAWLLQRLPLGVVRRSARAVAVFLYAVFPLRKAMTLAQIRRAFPDSKDSEIQQIARGSYVNLFTMLFELMWTPRLTAELLDSQFHFRNPEVLRAAVRRGQGVILMSGHFGNWEWLSMSAARILRNPLTIVVHPIHNAAVDMLVERWRTMHGNRVVPMGTAIREIVHTLRRRGVVAMIADQSGPSGSLFVRFFGRYAATYEGPATFALKMGAPVVIGFSLRRPDGSYDVVTHEIPTQDLKGASGEHIQELTRRHVRALEDMVRQRPDHWLWQHKRWKHSPHEGSTLVEDPVEECRTY